MTAETAALDGTRPTLYVHIGMPKTGTTALQKLLAFSEAELLAAGVHYFKCFRDAEGWGHHELPRFLLNDAPAAAAQLSEEFAQVCASSQWPFRAGLLSVEGLYPQLLEDAQFAQLEQFIQCLCGHFEVKLLLTLRELPGLLPSIYVQNMVYDRLTIPPVRFAQYVVNGFPKMLYRFAQNPEFASRCAVFEYGRQCNRQLLAAMGLEQLANSTEQLIHTTPENSRLLFVLLCHLTQKQLPADLLSFILFYSEGWDTMQAFHALHLERRDWTGIPQDEKELELACRSLTRHCVQLAELLKRADTSRFSEQSIAHLLSYFERAADGSTLLNRDNKLFALERWFAAASDAGTQQAFEAQWPDFVKLGEKIMDQDFSVALAS